MRPGQSYYNDPDQLLIGSNGLSRTEAEVQMGMWCDSQSHGGDDGQSDGGDDSQSDGRACRALWSAPMILSVEVRNGSLSQEMKAILLNRCG
jgi:hypothetical protein